LTHPARAQARLAAALFALASLDVFAQKEVGQVIGAMMFAIVLGFLACIWVELSAGQGTTGQRFAVGVAFAFFDAILFFTFLRITMQVAIASGPSQTSSGAGPLILFCLAAWIVPGLRLWWLKRARRP
jgi:hypothetical protein